MWRGPDAADAPADGLLFLGVPVGPMPTELTLSNFVSLFVLDTGHAREPKAGPASRLVRVTRRKVASG